MIKSFELDINGSCWENLVDSVPETAGIYFVYACFPNAEGNWFSGDLIYIGEAVDLRSRIKQHAIATDSTDNLHVGIAANYRRLWYTYALFAGSESDRKLCEAALIYKHKPQLNKAHVDCLGSSVDVEVVLRGETRKLVSHYTLGADA